MSRKVKIIHHEKFNNIIGMASQVGKDIISVHITNKKQIIKAGYWKDTHLENGYWVYVKPEQVMFLDKEPKRSDRNVQFYD